MAISPHTIVYLLNVPFENDYKNVVYWPNRSSQTSGMQSKIVKSYTNFTYQRKDNIIRIPDCIDNLEACNYVMYQNNDYTNKWFYAFITKKEFLNDHVTAVHIETDVYNTYCFDVSVNASFVEREHVKDDSIGANTVPEGLELGEYMVKSTYTDPIPCEDSWIVIAATTDREGNDVAGGSYGGIYSGQRYYFYTTPENANAAIEDWAKGSADAISSIFMVPGFLYESSGDSGSSVSTSVKQYDTNITVDNSIIGKSYTPKNKKLLTFPYRYLSVSNNNGGNAVYHYEKFFGSIDSGVVKFKVMAAICPGCSIRNYPFNYNGIGYNYDEGINLGKYPICNWSSDVFTNWITQNGVNVGIDMVTGVVGAVGGVITGNLGIAGASAIGVAHSIGEVYQHYLMPPQARGNINAGDVIFGNKLNTFIYYHMTIKDEYAKIIDDYFSMYGYKVNRLKVPNKNHRANFWYTKTIGANISGNIPNEDIKRYKQMYDDGVTFWRNMGTVENYDVDNSII